MNPFIEWEVIAIAHGEPVSAIEVRQTIGVPDIALVVERGVQRGIAAGGGVRRLRECIGSLEVSGAPTARERGLERVVVGVGVVGEDLEAAISIHTLQVRAGGTVGGSTFGNGELRAVIRSDSDRISSGRKLSLNVGAGLAEMDGVTTDIAELQNPLLT